MLKFTLSPYDVLYFGSGRPFNRGDVVDSVFPPYPHTFAGAICSKFKNINATSILKAVYGPFIKKDTMIYFPKPFNIYSERKKQEHNKFFVVKPLEKKLNLFDLQNTNKPAEVESLPTYKGTEEIEAFDGFISIVGLKKWLNGQELNKDDILDYKEIFKNEPRVGISIESTLYSVGSKEDALYRIEFLRLKKNFEFVFWAEFDFSDELKKVDLKDDKALCDFFNQVPQGLKLGGEMRNVHYDVEVNDFKDYIIKNLGIDENIDLDKNEKIQLLFLTYGIFDFCDSEKRIPQIDSFKMFSACYGNYRIVGLRSKNLRIDRLTKRAYPPGTVFWLESNNGKKGLKAISFLTKSNNSSYCIEEKKGGQQDFIGANLLLIKKGG